jgi:hypothetical protein
MTTQYIGVYLHLNGLHVKFSKIRLLLNNDNLQRIESQWPKLWDQVYKF